MQNPNEQWRKVVTKAWSDESFHQMLLANPVGTLKSEGIDVADGLNVHVHQASQNEMHLVIPAKPAGVSVEEATQQLVGDAHPGF